MLTRLAQFLILCISLFGCASTQEIVEKKTAEIAKKNLDEIHISADTRVGVMHSNESDERYRPAVRQALRNLRLANNGAKIIYDKLNAALPANVIHISDPEVQIIRDLAHENVDMTLARHNLDLIAMFHVGVYPGYMYVILVLYDSKIETSSGSKVFGSNHKIAFRQLEVIHLRNPETPSGWEIFDFRGKIDSIAAKMSAELSRSLLSRQR